MFATQETNTFKARLVIIITGTSNQEFLRNMRRDLTERSCETQVISDIADWREFQGSTTGYHSISFLIDHVNPEETPFARTVITMLRALHSPWRQYQRPYRAIVLVSDEDYDGLARYHNGIIRVHRHSEPLEECLDYLAGVIAEVHTPV